MKAEAVTEMGEWIHVGVSKKEEVTRVDVNVWLQNDHTVV